MNQQAQLLANLLEISSKSDHFYFSFYKEKQEGCFSIRAWAYPKALVQQFEMQEEPLPERLFTRFGQDNAADFSLEVKLQDHSMLHIKYLYHILWTFFAEQEVFLSKGFIDEIYVLVPRPDGAADYTTYDSYQLKITENDWSAKHLLLLRYDGKTLIHASSMLELDEELSALGKRFAFQRNIYSSRRLPEEAHYMKDAVYPVLTNAMKTAMDIPFKSRPGENVYLSQWEKINAFADKWLRHAGLQQQLHLASEAWVEVPEKKLFATSGTSNKLLLGRPPRSVLSPKIKLGFHGPFSLPSQKQVVFFVIFQENERDNANELYKALNNLQEKQGNKWIMSNNKSLYDYTRLIFNPDKALSFRYSSISKLMAELNAHLEQHLFDHDKHLYLAIYLSPISNNSKSPEELQVYYAMKELLLRYNISLQVIERDKLQRQEFRKYYIHNIAPAILAKLGGIPWQLQHSHDQELVIGVGAYRNSTNNTQYIGSAFSFNSNGTFREFNCMAKSELFVLAGDIKEFIRQHIQSFGKPERLVIHYYKTMSDKELKPISKMLHELDLDEIPIFIVTISKSLSQDYILFDQNFKELLPVSGTIAQIAKKQYLLFNNTRYDNNSKIESYHYPLRLRISCSSPALLDNVENVKRLIDQVYQFSRVYWKSVKQQNLPVTVSYPSMLAEMYSHFEEQQLNSFARTNLWFL